MTIEPMRFCSVLFVLVAAVQAKKNALHGWYPDFEDESMRTAVGNHHFQQHTQWHYVKVLSPRDPLVQDQEIACPNGAAISHFKLTHKFKSLVDNIVEDPVASFKLTCNDLEHGLTEGDFHHHHEKYVTMLPFAGHITCPNNMYLTAIECYFISAAQNLCRPQSTADDG